MISSLILKKFLKKNKIRIYQTNKLLLQLTNYDPIVYSFIIDCILRNDNHRLSEVPWTLYSIVKYDFCKLIDTDKSLITTITSCYLHNQLMKNELLKTLCLRRNTFKLKKILFKSLRHYKCVPVTAEKDSTAIELSNEQYRLLFKRLYMLSFEECYRICCVSRTHLTS